MRVYVRFFIVVVINNKKNKKKRKINSYELFKYHIHLDFKFFLFFIETLASKITKKERAMRFL